jgi:phosphotransferase system HPr (HPr) family protein
MLRAQLTITSPDGLHARPANEFSKLAATATGQVWLSRPEEPKVRGDSILAILTLGLKQGEIVFIEISDESQESLLKQLVSLLSGD